MQHALAFALKLVAMTAVVWVVMDPIFGVFSVSTAIITGVVLSVLSYGGDLIIVPRTKNSIAVTIDFILVALVIWIVGISVGGAAGTSLLGALIVALIAGVFEYPFHQYLLRKVLRHPYQTATHS
ncbi:DUF2512 family protein [Marinococcus halotolerans]|uniref:DUF2512 family protein n=1 Tax=Marinococcus halotolerans TaxID=301092 RepID=UPI0003B3BD9C|nr:DUF2512 family protein [Marinococcus halotolerans]